MVDTNSQPANGNGRRLTAEKIRRIIGWIFAGLVIACFVALVFGILVRWLWGVTLTPLFDLPQPTYWQAVGLILLGRLLFGGFGHHHKPPHPPYPGKTWHGHFDRFSGRSPVSSHGFGAEKKTADAYGDFWEIEGKKAFEDFLDRRRASGAAGDKEETETDGSR